MNTKCIANCKKCTLHNCKNNPNHTWKYYMTQRPPGPGCQPEGGLINISNIDREYPWVMHPWAILEYNRKLSQREIEDYELTEVENE